MYSYVFNEQAYLPRKKSILSSLLALLEPVPLLDLYELFPARYHFPRLNLYFSTLLAIITSYFFNWILEKILPAPLLMPIFLLETVE